MRRRKGSTAGSIVLLLLGLAVYFFFIRNTEELVKEEPVKEIFTPYYYTTNGRDIYYCSEADQKYPDHYVLAVTHTPRVPESPLYPGEPFGKEARDFVQAAILSRDIYLEHLKHSLYVYVWLDEPGDSSDIEAVRERMLNAQLISRGYSEYLPSEAPSLNAINPTYNEVFLSLQKEAQAKCIGIWSLPEKSSSKTQKYESEKISVYLGENRVLIDPNEDADDEISQSSSNNSEVSVSVVVTPKGKKYHYADCRTVKKKYRVLTVAQARKQGYKPCKVCNPPSH